MTILFIFGIFASLAGLATDFYPSAKVNDLPRKKPTGGKDGDLGL